MATTALTLAGISNGALERSLSGEIWDKARQDSIIPNLAKSAPIVMGENSFPVVSKRPTASIVGESQPKPGSDISIANKVIKPIKSVVGIELSMEFILANPAGALDYFKNTLSSALTESVDLAVLHGRDATTGKLIESANIDYVNQTTNRVGIASGTNPDTALWESFDDVTSFGYNVNGFAFDPRMKSLLARAVDSNGARLNNSISMGNGLSDYSGIRAYSSPVVSGAIANSTDTGVRAFAGDWDALRFGYAMDIIVKEIPFGDPFGNGDLAGRNHVAYLAEVAFGHAILDKNAFSAVEVETAADAG